MRSFFIIFLCYLSVLIILLLPLALTEHPPLIDYPNHLARHHIVNVIDHDSKLQHFYHIRWLPLPYLSSDLLAAPLFKIFSAYVAGRILLGIIITLWLTALMVLHRVVWGRYSAWPLFAGLFIYNAMLGSGAEGFLITSALAIFALAAWIHFRGRTWPTRLAIFAPAFTAIYFGHVLVFGWLTLLVLSYEFSLLVHARRTGKHVVNQLLLTLLNFVPGYLFFVLLLRNRGPGFNEQGHIATWDKLPDHLGFGPFKATI